MAICSVGQPYTALLIVGIWLVIEADLYVGELDTADLCAEMHGDETVASVGGHSADMSKVLGKIIVGFWGYFSLRSCLLSYS